jgi:hypothetical protein
LADRVAYVDVDWIAVFVDLSDFHTSYGRRIGQVEVSAINERLNFGRRQRLVNRIPIRRLSAERVTDSLFRDHHIAIEVNLSVNILSHPVNNRVHRRLGVLRRHVNEPDDRPLVFILRALESFGTTIDEPGRQHCRRQKR